MKKILIMFAVFSFTFYSCGDASSVEEKINTEIPVEHPAFVGMWLLDKMDLSGEIVKSEVLGNPTYSFNGDFTYVIRSGGQSEVGIWKFNNDVLSLTSDKNKVTDLKIIKSDKDFLYYEIGDEPKTKVYLNREVF